GGPPGPSPPAGPPGLDGLAAPAPPTRTRPARTAWVAASRLGASPRRTSSRSTRTLAAIGGPQPLEAAELVEDGGTEPLEHLRVRGQLLAVELGQDLADVLAQ